MGKVCIFDGFNYVLIAAYGSQQRRDFNDDAINSISDTLYNMLRKFIKEHIDVDKFYSVWDTFGGTSFRKAIDNNYKSTREKSALSIDAIKSMKEIFEMFSIVTIEVPQTEADDIIHSLAKSIRNKDKDTQIIIVSRDRDLLQSCQKYNCNLYDVVTKKYVDIPQYDITIFKALVGDSSDNIKGVTGIGKKKALLVMNNTLLLNEAQKDQFNKALSIVDIEKNPKFEEYVKLMTNLIDTN